MLIALPILCYLLIFFWFRMQYVELRYAVVAASVIWATILTILTEASSALQMLNFKNLVVSWICIDGMIGFILYMMYKKIDKSKIEFERLKKINMAQLSFVLIILLVTLIIALQAPPNTWDSMTYHMSRVAHWIENQSIDFYPTHILRQNHQMPFSEWMILHLQILSNGDRFANFVQWSCMAGSLIAVSLIVKQLGGMKNAQVLACVICATIPMGILQSSSTQNDYVASFWMACLVYFILQLNTRYENKTVLFIGCTLGLALLTKATCYIYAFPFMIYMGSMLIIRYKIKGVTGILIIVIVAMLFNVGHFIRNNDLYGNFLGPGHEGSEEYRYRNEKINSSIAFANIVRNIGLHLSTPFVDFNKHLERAIVTVLGKEVNNPASTWGETSFAVPQISYHEDNTGNPIHLILSILAITFVAVSRKNEWKKRLYAFCLAGGFLIFCVYLRWQPWHSRLHLPIFVLASPLVAIWIAKILRTDKRMTIFCVVICCLALPWLFLNRSRPILQKKNIFNIPRIEQYFANRSDLLIPYTEAVESLVTKGKQAVGIICWGDDWEYPLHVLLKEKCGDFFSLRHIHVENASKKFNKTSDNLNSIVALHYPLQNFIYNNIIYRRIWHKNDIAVFIRPENCTEMMTNERV